MRTLVGLTQRRLYPLPEASFSGRGIIVVACSFTARVIRKALFSAANRGGCSGERNRWYMDIDMPSSFFNRALWLPRALEDAAMFRMQ